MMREYTFTALPIGWRNVIKTPEGDTVLRTCPGVLTMGPLTPVVFAWYGSGGVRSIHDMPDGFTYVTTLAPGEEWEN
jgi:hypothetical protein